MKYLPNVLIYAGGYHLVSTIVLYILIRLFSYQQLQSQYSEGGIDAVFGITTGNYNFGLFLSSIFAVAAVLKGYELNHTEGKFSKSRLVFSGILAIAVIFLAVYFTFLNLLILINPGYF